MRRLTIIFLFIIVILYLLSSLAFCQSGIQQEIDQFNGFTGLLFQDLSTREILFSHNQDRLFTPASLVKLFTFLAALEILGPGYRYTTSFYFSSEVPGEIQSDLFIKGSGDPTHSPEIIRKIANDLVKKYDIRSIGGDITLDDSLFCHEEFLGKGWMWDDENPLISAFVVKEYSTRVKSLSYYRTMPLIWGELFCQELFRLGVWFDGDIRIGEIEEGLTIKAVHHSETLDQILTSMMKMSDNQSAEIVFRTLPLIKNPIEASTINMAITSFSELIDERLGLHWGEDYFIVDGCGLSEYNLLTPSQVVKVICYLFQEFGSDVLKYLASTSEKGTIKERFAFQLWGKTGSLPSASGLAGILQTKKNRLVVFCLMEDNFRGEQNDPKVFEDKVIEYIYEHY